MGEKLNYLSAIKFLIKYIRMHKHMRHFIRFLLGWFFQDVIFVIVMPILLGVMIDEIVYYTNMDVFLQTSGVLLMMSIFSAILYFLIFTQHHYLMSMYTFDIRRDVFKHLQKCDAEYMTDSSTGDVIATMQWYSTECMHFVIRNIIHMFNRIISLIATSIYVFVISWQIGLVLLTVVPITVFINTKYGKKIREYGDKQREYYGGYISWVFEILSALRDIRMLGAVEKTNSDFKDKHNKMFNINIKSSISTITAESIIAFVGLFIQLLIFSFAGWLALHGAITIGLLTVILAFYAVIIRNVTFISSAYLDAQNRISYIQRIYDFLHSPTENEWNGKAELVITSGNISFKNISFAYNKSDVVLDNLNLDISAGGRFALVGRSGCGKTTLAYMLIGFYRPQIGEILIDGQRLIDCNLKSIRKNIGLIAQDVLIFGGSIRENILLGNKKATDDEVEFACKQSGIWDFIETLPHKLDTIIGSNGLGLSGGQKQRVAIARIYLKNPKIIIFDEATSSLDCETEESIHKAWENVLVDRTSIIIAHRQSSVMLCDNAAILENGKICETGAPTKMASESFLFKTLFAVKEMDANV